jgi:putative transposase
VKSRERLITPEAERVIFDGIRVKSAELECPILALNGVEDHLHIALNIPPKVSVAEWAKKVKGTVSHDVNTLVFPNEASRFRWQDGYGVLTFGVKQLEFVVRYIERQKERHAAGSVIRYMEAMEEPY